jgi:hypothetical protein
MKSGMRKFARWPFTASRAVLVVVDRHGTLQRGIGEVLELGAQIAPVVVERQHQLVVDQRQPLD